MRNLWLRNVWIYILIIIFVFIYFCIDDLFLFFNFICKYGLLVLGILDSVNKILYVKNFVNINKVIRIYCKYDIEIGGIFFFIIFED